MSETHRSPEAPTTPAGWKKEFETYPWAFYLWSLMGVEPAIYENLPQIGYYRTKRAKNGGGGWEHPVAIFRNTAGDLVALKSGTSIDPVAIWTWCSRYAIPFQTYKAVLAGEPWPDAPEAGGEVGDNSGEELPRDKQFLARINDRQDEYRAWLKSIGGKILTKEHADKAAGFKEIFAKARTESEKARKAEKDPILAAGREIDAKWKVVDSAAVNAETKVGADVRPYLLELQRVEAAARKAAEEARLKAISDAAAAAPQVAPAPPPPSRQEPIKAGSSGRGVRLQKVRYAVIEDIEKVKAAFIASPEGEEKAREWAITNGPRSAIPIPGVRIDEKDEVR